MTSTGKVDGSALTGVSETALMTLQVRANEARRPDALIDDPMAIQLVDAIDFDFAKFGYSRRQDMALRAKAFDHHTRRYLLDHPKATVVALAEGLQTSFYRLDAAGVGHEFRWLTVDLPPMIELREKLLPPSDRITMLAQSALDFTWRDFVDASDGVFITAEGLLMYLDPDDALALIRECAARFPGGGMMLDNAPPFFSRRTLKGFNLSDRYTAPPMPFAMTPHDGVALARTVPGVRSATDIEYPTGRPMFTVLGWRPFNRGPLSRYRPSITLLEFER